MRTEVHEATSHMRRHWWYRGRTVTVASLARRAGVRPGGRVLDFGCGAGLMGETLARFGEVHGVEASADALGFGEYGAYASVTQADSLDAADFPRGSFDLISVLDVIEHVPDDAGLLRGLAELLSVDGRMLVSVPMWPDLFCATDEDNHHLRRYTPETLVATLDAAGLRGIARTGYVWAMLPVAAAHRRAIRDGRATSTGEFDMPSAPVNAVASLIAVTEGACSRVAPVPTGLSEVVVCERAGEGAR